MVRYIVAETSLEIIRERVAEFDFQVSKMPAERDTVLSEAFLLGKPVYFPQEFPCIEIQRFMSFLELVEFFNDCDRYDNVVLLEMVYGLVGDTS